jgi:hypothetical protein
MKIKAKIKPFNSLNVAQKRIAIAQDVLLQIKLEKYNIMEGTWAEFQDDDDLINDLSLQFRQDILRGGIVTFKIPQPVCNVCAIGAACCSALRLGNVDVLESDTDEGDMRKVLKKYFGIKQMGLIESCFEQRLAGDCKFGNLSKKESDRALLFSRKFDDQTDRAIAIFQNIIQNKGVFKP